MTQEELKYINELTQWAIQNPEKFWGAEGAKEREWLYNHGAGDQVAEIYYNTPQNIQSTISDKLLPNKIKIERLNNQQHQATEKAVPFVLGAAAAPYIVGSSVLVSPALTTTIKETGRFLATDVGKQTLKRALSDFAISSAVGETGNSVARSAGYNGFGDYLLQNIGADPNSKGYKVKEFAADMLNPGYFLGAGLANQLYNKFGVINPILKDTASRTSYQAVEATKNRLKGQFDHINSKLNSVNDRIKASFNFGRQYPEYALAGGTPGEYTFRVQQPSTPSTVSVDDLYPRRVNNPSSDNIVTRESSLNNSRSALNSRGSSISDEDIASIPDELVDADWRDVARWMREHLSSEDESDFIEALRQRRLNEGFFADPPSWSTEPKTVPGSQYSQLRRLGLGQYDIRNLIQRGYTPDQIINSGVDFSRALSNTSNARANDIDRLLRSNGVVPVNGTREEFALTSLVDGNVYHAPSDVSEISALNLPNSYQVSLGQPVTFEEVTDAIERGILPSDFDIESLRRATPQSIHNYYGNAANIQSTNFKFNNILDEVFHGEEGNTLNKALSNFSPEEVRNLLPQIKSIIKDVSSAVDSTPNITKNEARELLHTRLKGFFEDELNTPYKLDLPKSPKDNEYIIQLLDESGNKVGNTISLDSDPRLFGARTEQPSQSGRPIYTGNINGEPHSWEFVDMRSPNRFESSDYTPVYGSAHNLLRNIFSDNPIIPTFSGSKSRLSITPYNLKTVPIEFNASQAVGTPGTVSHMSFFSPYPRQMRSLTESMFGPTSHGVLIFEPNKSMDSTRLFLRQAADRAKKGKGTILWDGLKDAGSTSNMYQYTETNGLEHSTWNPAPSLDTPGEPLMKKVTDNVEAFRRALEATNPRVFEAFGGQKPEFRVGFSRSRGIDDMYRVNFIEETMPDGTKKLRTTLFDVDAQGHHTPLYDRIKDFDSGALAEGSPYFELPIAGYINHKLGGKILKRR